MCKAAGGYCPSDPLKNIHFPGSAVPLTEACASLLPRTSRPQAQRGRAQAQMLRTPACYIGVIGSRAKIAAVREILRGEGFGDGDFERITTPIGLDIKAETPAEIAISIAARLIELRAGRASA